MPLTATFVKSVKFTPKPGNKAKARYHADGAGLYLRVTQAQTRNWVFRFARNGTAREMGLGSVADVPLIRAREKAGEARALLADGKDPITARRTVQAAETPKRWGEVCDAYIADVVAPDKKATARKSKGSVHQWGQSLRDHGPRRDLLVTEVTRAVVLACLKPLWKSKDEGGKMETATRLRQRMEKVLGYATVKGYRSGDNPATLAGNLEIDLPKSSVLRADDATNFASMPYARIPDFMEELRERVTPSARALEILIYTATRTSEVVRGFQWSEVNGDVWTIPPERMKGRRKSKKAKQAAQSRQPHEIPLTAEALAAFDCFDREESRPLNMSENTMLDLLHGMNEPFTVHGFRATFRTWAEEETDYPPHVIEACLAHVETNKAHAAYKRGQMLAHRRQLMEAWALFVAGKPYPKRLQYDD